MASNTKNGPAGVIRRFISNDDVVVEISQDQLDKYPDSLLLNCVKYNSNDDNNNQIILSSINGETLIKICNFYKNNMWANPHIAKNKINNGDIRNLEELCMYIGLPVIFEDGDDDDDGENEESYNNTYDNEFGKYDDKKPVNLKRYDNYEEKKWTDYLDSLKPVSPEMQDDEDNVYDYWQCELCGAAWDYCEHT